MPFRKSGRRPPDRISSEQLARFGRYLFLDSKLNGRQQQDTFSWVSPLASLIWSGDPDGRASVIAELRRHSATGEWEKVGAWKFVREFLDEAPDTQDLIDGGLLTVARMRVTNLRVNLAPIDTPRYEELTGGPVPHDGFFGPPTFDSAYGPARQYYLDSAVAAAARRMITRLPHVPGVAPGPVAGAARSMWDFGMLVYRGPAVINPDITFEPNVVRPAVIAASGVDHALFLDQVAEAVLDPASHLATGFAPIGGARFAEDYLDPAAMAAQGYRRLLDTGLSWLLNSGEPGLMVSPDLLTPIQHDRLARLRLAGGSQADALGVTGDGDQRTAGDRPAVHPGQRADLQPRVAARERVVVVVHQPRVAAGREDERRAGTDHPRVCSRRYAAPPSTRRIWPVM